MLLGFCVARIKDVKDAAKDVEKGVKGSCIQERSLVDVSIGKVSILALSADSSMLAVSVGSNLYFFSVDRLLNKVCADLVISFTNCLTIKVHSRLYFNLTVSFNC